MEAKVVNGPNNESPSGDDCLTADASFQGTGQTLLDAIEADPEDDVARLTYADWLADRDDPGDAERAGLIHVQVHLARREEELLKQEPLAKELKYGQAVCQAILEYTQWEVSYGFRRGLRPRRSG